MIIARINDDLLFRHSDGTEAFLIFKPGAVSVVTDIHAMGAPHNAVTLEPAELRSLADEIERRSAQAPSDDLG
jgi:hypothetical protein